jgi:hypothetical protein
MTARKCWLALLLLLLVGCAAATPPPPPDYRLANFFERTADSDRAEYLRNHNPYWDHVAGQEAELAATARLAADQRNPEIYCAHVPALTGVADWYDTLAQNLVKEGKTENIGRIHQIINTMRSVAVACQEEARQQAVPRTHTECATDFLGVTHCNSY